MLQLVVESEAVAQAIECDQEVESWLEGNDIYYHCVTCAPMVVLKSITDL